MRIAVAMAVAALLAGCGGTAPVQEERRSPAESEPPVSPSVRIDTGEEYALPPPPEEANLVPVTPRSRTDNAIALDSRSLVVGADRVVRYTLVVTSPEGARNVLHEAMSCKPFEWKLLAIGRSDGSWARPMESVWQPVERRSYNGIRYSLGKNVFCEKTGSPARDAARILERIREDDEFGKIDPYMR
jgi:hypothetical protein